MTSANSDQAEFWSAIAPTWLELESNLEQIGGLPGRMAMDRLELVAGQTVLDVGCGLGGTTLELASRVAPGDVLGVDIAEGMISSARERAERVEAGNVVFLLADAEVDDLGEARFDAAFSRFGVMFFANPVAAFSNIRRSLRPGATLSFACWQTVFDNEWMLVPGMAAMSVLGPMEMPDPEAPGPFSLADPDRVRRVLEGAGFGDIVVDPHKDQVESAEDLVPVLASTSTRIGLIHDALKDAGDETRARVVEAIEEALRSRVEHGSLRVTRGVNLVTARVVS